MRFGEKDVVKITLEVVHCRQPHTLIHALLLDLQCWVEQWCLCCLGVLSILLKLCDVLHMVVSLTYAFTTWV